MRHAKCACIASFPLLDGPSQATTITTDANSTQRTAKDINNVASPIENAYTTTTTATTIAIANSTHTLVVENAAIATRTANAIFIITSAVFIITSAAHTILRTYPILHKGPCRRALGHCACCALRACCCTAQRVTARTGHGSAQAAGRQVSAARITQRLTGCCVKRWGDGCPAGLAGANLGATARAAQELLCIVAGALLA